MPPLSILVKPASSMCNMRCEYCFYEDISAKREVASRGLMSLDTLETIVKKAFEYATDFCSFSFQGGEPTLAGIEFFEKLIEYEERHNINNLPVYHGFQTNGTMINKEWASFFKKNNFLVGVSLDGSKDINDTHRVDAKKNGTFAKVMQIIELLKAEDVEFNILTVVTRKTARNIKSVYSFFKKNSFVYQQYIPCLEPLGEEIGSNKYSLSSDMYSEFLVELFDLWYRDAVVQSPTSIRFFDNLLAIVAGYPPESCDMQGVCSVQFVIESDGSVYPCDFYAIDKYDMGRIQNYTFEELLESKNAKDFIEAGRERPLECRQCNWFNICRGGCRRNWEPFDISVGAQNYYCRAYKSFYIHAYPKLVELARSITNAY